VNEYIVVYLIGKRGIYKYYDGAEMAEIGHALVICVDRDNDLGKKAKIKGPIIGREAAIKAAAKLALVDPEDSDVNAVFAAVKKFREVKKLYPASEIAILTGHGKSDLESDKEIHRQLDNVLGMFPADGIVLVTDGAEDDQVIPILQSRAPIISKETIHVKQAKEVESTFYTIKEALKDPYLERMVFGVPGLLLILYSGLFFLNAEQMFFPVMAGVIGAYFIARGTGLEEKVTVGLSNFSKSFSLQRTSFPFYLAMIFIFAFGLMSAYTSYFIVGIGTELVDRVASAISPILAFTVLASYTFIIGRVIDAIHVKKAYLIRRYFLTAVFVSVGWFIIETGKGVVIGEADLSIFLLAVLASFIAGLVAYRVSFVFDIRRKVTKLLIGIPVYNKEGSWIGKVENVQKTRNLIEYRDHTSKRVKIAKKKEFILREGKVLLLS